MPRFFFLCFLLDEDSLEKTGEVIPSDQEQENQMIYHNWVFDCTVCSWTMKLVCHAVATLLPEGKAGLFTQCEWGITAVDSRPEPQAFLSGATVMRSEPF